MHLLTEVIGLKAEQDFRSFDLAKVEAVCSHFLGGRQDWVDVGPHILAKFVGFVDDLSQDLFFLGLKRQILDLVLPIDQVFKLGSSCVSGYLHTIVADRASILVVLLDFAASNLEAFAVIPVCMSVQSPNHKIPQSYHS